MERVDVAIVGGGIAGLCVADRLMRQAPDLTCRVYEASDRAGGKVLTEVVETDDGRFLVEAGPDAWLAQKPWAMELIDDLGLGDDVIPINRTAQPVSIVRGSRIVHLPEGIGLVAPADPWAFARSRLLSPFGMLRMTADLVLPAREGDADESLGSFVTRRFGREALERLAEPLAAGIYNADPDRMGLRATFPHLLEFERKHGSVIRGMRNARKRTGDHSRPTFLTLRTGMGTLVDALIARVGQVLETSAAVDAIEPDEEVGYVVQVSDRVPVRTDTVVLAVSAAPAAALLESVAPETASTLATLRAVHAGTITLAYRSSEISRPLPGYGLVIPAVERRPINAVTITSRKFDGRAPEGWTLLRVFFGGWRSPQSMDLDDAALLAVVRPELHHLLGVSSPPAWHRIHRWPAGSPQYDVGHLERAEAIEETLPVGIHVTGSPYRGVGIPDVIHQARQTADRLVAVLSRPQNVQTASFA